MIAVGYIRISPRPKGYHGVSMDVQAKAIKDYCKYKGIELAAIYGDKYISGKNIKDRPGVNTVLEMADKRVIDCVITYKLDRFMRNTIETLDTCAFLEDRGVKFVSLNEEINTSTATGRFFLTVLAGLGQMEREQTSERTKAALAFKRASGVRISRRAPYGFKFIKGSDKIYRNYKEIDAYERHLELREMKVPYEQHGRIMYAEGFSNRNGKPYSFSDLFRLRKAFRDMNWDEMWDQASPDPDVPEDGQEITPVVSVVRGRQ